MSEKQEAEMISIEKLKPDPNQPRTEWDDERTREHIKELAASYTKHGIIQPIEVDENNVIILGECRWRAAKRVGLKRVPIRRVSVVSDEDRLERQLIDDAQRQELNDFERRWAYAAAVASINDSENTYIVSQVKKMWSKKPHRLVELIRSQGGRRSTGFAELSRRIGIPQTIISKYLVYFDIENIPHEVQEAIDERLMTSSEASEIRRIKTEKARKTIAKAVAEERRMKKIKGKRPHLAVRVLDRVEAIREIEDDVEEGIISKPSDELIEAAAKAEIPPEATRYIAEVEPELQPRVIEQVKEFDTSQAADAAREIASRLPRRVRVDVQESLARFVREEDGRREGDQALLIDKPRLDIGFPEQYHQQRLWNIRRLLGSERPNGLGPFRFDVITTGFSQKSLDGLLETLEEAEVKLLLDIRKNPVSQYRPEFNKNNLSDKLSVIGIEYEHIPALGIPRDLRNKALSNEITVNELWGIYDREILTSEMIEQLNKRINDKGTVALFCTEVSPELCHRHRVALALEKIGRLCFDV